MLLTTHILAGGLAMIFGAVALSVKKGGTVHRTSGLCFVVAMLIMSASASILAFRKSPADQRVYSFLMTGYFVGTAMTTVRPSSQWTRRFDVFALVVVLLLALGTLKHGFDVAFHAAGSSDGTPLPMHFVLAGVMLLAGLGDVRIMRVGAPQGPRRFARHLWRMCFALFIAAGSFFSIRARVAKVLPPPFTTEPMRAFPILLLFGVMFFWLWKLRRDRATSAVRPRSQ